MLSNQLKERLLLGSLGIPVLIFIIYFSYIPLFKPVFVLSTLLITTLALLEFYQLALNKGIQPLIYPGMSCTIAYLLGVYTALQNPSLYWLPPFILFISLLIFFSAFFKKNENSLVNLAVTLLGFAYLTIPLSFILKLNYFVIPSSYWDGRLWLTYVIIVTKMTDVGGYFFGKMLGRTKLAPLISPKKTIEGALGGILLALVTSLFFYYLQSTHSSLSLHITLWQSIWMALLISLFAQFGDLSESILKRDAGIKDSGHLPGLGGVLDIVDSLVFTLPLMYFILEIGL